METGSQPRVAILLATYNPNLEWFAEQLQSINKQTYKNLILYVRDDCSIPENYDAVVRLIKEIITCFPVYMFRNEINMGSNGTFEMLTQEAKGDYFAYCDQDDIWHADKIEIELAEIINSGAQLVCSDMNVIDGCGTLVARSITEVRRRHVFLTGAGLGKKLIVSNWVTGTTMLIPALVAKMAIPFCPHMVHDHYLALFCAYRGVIVSLPDRLIDYRIHGSNQTSVLAGVFDKESYYRIRIAPLESRMLWLLEHFKCDKGLKSEIEDCLVWMRARKNNWMIHRDGALVWKYRRFGYEVALFEWVLALCPEWIFKFSLLLIKRNII